MTSSRRFRFLFVGTMLTVIVVVLLLTAGVLARQYYPDWREHAIQQALAESKEPAFWWPPSWREEHAKRQSRFLLRIKLSGGIRLQVPLDLEFKEIQIGLGAATETTGRAEDEE